MEGELARCLVNWDLPGVDGGLAVGSFMFDACSDASGEHFKEPSVSIN